MGGAAFDVTGQIRGTLRFILQGWGFSVLLALVVLVQTLSLTLIHLEKQAALACIASMWHPADDEGGVDATVDL